MCFFFLEKPFYGYFIRRLVGSKADENNIYRSFNPKGGINAKEKFKYQLQCIKEANSLNMVLLGDFNLDYNKLHDVNYARKILFEDFQSELEHLELIQLVKFETWSRIVGFTMRESILDHIYVKDPTTINDVKGMTPVLGDHKMIIFHINICSG